MLRRRGGLWLVQYNQMRPGASTPDMARANAPETARRPPMVSQFPNNKQKFDSWFTRGSHKGGVARIYYGWMAPGSFTRRRFEKMRNPFVDLESGTSLYYRDTRDSPEAMRAHSDAMGSLKGNDNAMDLYNEYKIVPDLYPEGFQWKHKLNTEYNQWRSNTWVTPDLIPAEHRGRFLCNFQLNIVEFNMRVAKFSPKDHRQWIYCLLYIGTGKGIAGWGRAVAPSTQEAKKEAIRNAYEHVVAINLENEGPIYPIRINHDGARVLLYPAKKIVATFLIADILCAFGLQHAGCKVNNSPHAAPHSRARHVGGVFEAVSIMRTATEIAHMRGKVPSSLLHNIFPYLEEIRRRKGMMAMHPSGKDGLFPSTRVIDNRMPDHLKKGYFDDIYWKDFFAGNAQQLNEPKLGLRGDQLRALVVQKNERGGAAQNTTTRQGQSTRRTLADVLLRMNKTVDALGSQPVANPFWDAKVSTHAKAHFHLH